MIYWWGAELRESSGSHASRRPVQEGDVFRTSLDEVLKVEQTRQNNASSKGETPPSTTASLFLGSSSTLS